MSVEKVSKAVEDFLKEIGPGVLSIKGSWGAGKTYFWSKAVKEAADKKLFSTRYAYVSLFGITSLDELKYAIFEQTVDSSQIGKEFTLENVKTNLNLLRNQLSRKSYRFLRDIPVIKNIGSAIQSASYLSVRDTLICLDDLERKGDSLITKDILGLVSLLREQRNCKVVLIFNQYRLDKKSTKDYKSFREKVIDVEVNYAPKAEEAANIVFPRECEKHQMLRDISSALGIRNIRILRKLNRFFKLVDPLLAKGAFEPELLSTVIHSAAIGTLCYYSHDNNLPGFAYLKSKGYSGFNLNHLNNENAPTKKEQQWDAWLTKHNFLYTDELDNEIFTIIDTGYVVEASFLDAASTHNALLIANKSENSVKQAWSLYHNSFNDNADELVTALVKAIKLHGGHISPSNLNSTIKLLKNLGKQDEASQSLSAYVDLNLDRPKVFDLDMYAFGDNVDDLDIINTFHKLTAKSQETFTLKDAVQNLAENDGWGKLEEEVLFATTTEQFYKFFKEQNSESLRSYALSCLQFGTMAGTTEEQRKISDKAKKALQKIAKESELNGIRVRGLGVDVED